MKKRTTIRSFPGAQKPTVLVMDQDTDVINSEEAYGIEKDGLYYRGLPPDTDHVSQEYGDEDYDDGPNDEKYEFEHTVIGRDPLNVDLVGQKVAYNLLQAAQDHPDSLIVGLISEIHSCPFSLVVLESVRLRLQEKGVKPLISLEFPHDLLQIEAKYLLSKRYVESSEIDHDPYYEVKISQALERLKRELPHDYRALEKLFLAYNEFDEASTTRVLLGGEWLKDPDLHVCLADLSRSKDGKTLNLSDAWTRQIVKKCFPDYKQHGNFSTTSNLYPRNLGIVRRTLAAAKDASSRIVLLSSGMSHILGNKNEPYGESLYYLFNSVRGVVATCTFIEAEHQVIGNFTHDQFSNDTGQRAFKFSPYSLLVRGADTTHYFAQESISTCQPDEHDRLIEIFSMSGMPRPKTIDDYNLLVSNVEEYEDTLRQALQRLVIFYN